jgi:hypothetical protein
MFPGPRKFMAVVIAFGVAALGYGTIVGLHILYTNIHPARPIRLPQEGEIQRPPEPRRHEIGGRQLQIPVHSKGETRTEAGTPQRIGLTEVCIVRTTRAVPGAVSGTGGLTITLRITNRGLAPVTYHRRGLTLRDRAKPPTNYPLLEPPTENPTVAANATIEDVLVFGQTSMLHILDLDLPASGSDEQFHFFIPSKFIKAGTEG